MTESVKLATVYFSSPERGRRTEYGSTAGELGGNSQGVFPTAPIQYRNQPAPVRSSIVGAPNFFLRWLQRMLRTELQGPEGEHLGFFVRVSTWNGVYQNRGEWQPVVDRSGGLLKVIQCPVVVEQFQKSLSLAHRKAILITTKFLIHSEPRSPVGGPETKIFPISLSHGMEYSKILGFGK